MDRSNSKKPGLPLVLKWNRDQRSKSMQTSYSRDQINGVQVLLENENNPKAFENNPTAFVILILTVTIWLMW